MDRGDQLLVSICLLATVDRIPKTKMSKILFTIVVVCIAQVCTFLWTRINFNIRFRETKVQRSVFHPQIEINSIFFLMKFTACILSCRTSTRTSSNNHFEPIHWCIEHVEWHLGIGSPFIFERRRCRKWCWIFVKGPSSIRHIPKHNQIRCYRPKWRGTFSVQKISDLCCIKCLNRFCYIFVWFFFIYRQNHCKDKLKIWSEHSLPKLKMLAKNWKQRIQNCSVVTPKNYK